MKWVRICLIKNKILIFANHFHGCKSDILFFIFTLFLANKPERANYSTPLVYNGKIIIIVSY